MNSVFSLLVPLFCWASYGFGEGLSVLRPSRHGFGAWWRLLRRRGNCRTSHKSGAAVHPFQLKWPERESFFDGQVQLIMKERHPSSTSFGRRGFKGYPIDAWTAVDQFARTAGTSERSLAEFGVFMRLDPIWISKLLCVVTQAHEKRNRPHLATTDACEAENRRREQIIQEWAECWLAHYRLHDSVPCESGEAQGGNGRKWSNTSNTGERNPGQTPPLKYLN